MILCYFAWNPKVTTCVKRPLHPLDGRNQQLSSAGAFYTIHLYSSSLRPTGDPPVPQTFTTCRYSVKREVRRNNSGPAGGWHGRCRRTGWLLPGKSLPQHTAAASEMASLSSGVAPALSPATAMRAAMPAWLERSTGEEICRQPVCTCLLWNKRDQLHEYKTGQLRLPRRCGTVRFEYNSHSVCCKGAAP